MRLDDILELCDPTQRVRIEPCRIIGYPDELKKTLSYSVLANEIDEVAVYEHQSEWRTLVVYLK